MNLGISPHYKTLIALGLVTGPLIWLLFTSDGQRRTDLVLMPLLGRPNVELSLAELSSALEEADIRARLPQLDLQCTQAETPFGDSVCAARIGSFGRLPAEGLAFVFSCGGLRAVKLTYRPDVQGELLNSLTRQLGEGGTNGYGAAGGPMRVVGWPVSDGVLLLNADLRPGEDPALLWLSWLAVEGRRDAAEPGGG
jgi:hypothetical protein